MVGWTSPNTTQDAVARSPLLSWDSINHPVVTVPPSTTAISGVPLILQPVITILDQTGITDLLTIGPVTVTVIGTSVLSGVSVGVAILGVVAFLGLTLTGSATVKLLFSLPNGQSVLSSNITVL